MKEADRIFNPVGYADTAWSISESSDDRRKQEKIIDLLKTFGKENNPPEIKGVRATRDYSEIAWFLNQTEMVLPWHTYSLNNLTIAGSMEISIEWLLKCERTTIIAEKSEFPAIAIPQPAVRSFKLEGHDFPVFRLSTSNDDAVFATIFQQPSQKKPLSDLDLMFRAMELSKSATQEKTIDNYGRVVLPMLKISDTRSISWLKGIKHIITDKSQIQLNDAFCQIKLNVNSRGAKPDFKMQSSNKPDYIFDKPFLIWLTRKTLQFPLFVIVTDKKDWAEPNTPLEHYLRIH